MNIAMGSFDLAVAVFGVELVVMAVFMVVNAWYGYQVIKDREWEWWEVFV